MPEVPEEPLEARWHEPGEHSGRFGGHVPKGMDGPPRHVQELPWSQRTPGVPEEDFTTALQHEEEFVRICVCMGHRTGRPRRNKQVEEGIMTTRVLAGGEKIEALP